MITKGMEKLKKLIDEYSKLMSNINLSPNVQFSGTGGLNFGATGGKSGSNTVTIKDYGAKYLSGIDDIQDYGAELANGVENALRG
jgi:hypothetical protein